MPDAKKQTAMNTKEKESAFGEKKKSNLGRKAESGNVRLRPIFREEPDMEKLGRAIIAMAVNAVRGDTQGQTDEKIIEEEV